MDTSTKTTGRVTPWNKGKLLGQKPPLKLKEIWAIRIRLQLDHRARELAFFNLAIDSKLRGCDLVGLRVHNVMQGRGVAPRAIVMQKKTKRPVQFEITEQNARCGCAMDQRGAFEAGAVPFSQPSVGVAASFDAAVFADRRVVGRVNRAGPGGPRYPFPAPHETDADLSADQKSPGGSAIARS